MCRYVMTCMRVVVVLCFFDTFHNVKGTHIYDIYATARNYTWTTANASCALLGSDLTGSLLADQVKITKGKIQSRGWIGAHVITNGTVQFTGCFIGSLNSEPGLIVTTDHVLHCNYFCNASGFMFYKNICYCIKHTENKTNERCTGRFYRNATYIVYGTDIKEKRPCLCRYEQVGDERGKHPNKLAEQNLNSTLNPCYGPPYFNSTGDEVMNNDLNLVRVTVDINGTPRTVWNITWTHLNTMYSAYWTGIVRQDIFVWGSYGKHSSANVNAPLSCVSLLLNIPVMTGKHRMSKGMLFPVKDACDDMYPGICVQSRKSTTTMQSTTAASKTTNAAAQLSTSIYYTAGQLGTSIAHTLGQLSTSTTNTAGQLSTSISNTISQLSTSKNNTTGQLSASISNTEHRTSETSTEGVSSNSMHSKTAKQTTIFRVNSELPPNSYPSPSDVSSIRYGYSSEETSSGATYVNNIWYHITSTQSLTPNLNQPTMPVSGFSTGISSSLLGSVIGGAVSFVVIVVACVVLIVCLKRDERSNMTMEHNN